MRTAFLVCVALLLGGAAGTGLAFYRIQQAPWNEKDNVAAKSTDGEKKETASLDPLRPRAEIDKADHNFGSMDRNAVGQHDFIIRNVGKKPLTLAKGSTSCKCTMANPEKETVQPGESTAVRLEWKMKGFSGPYKQSATLLTNDPERSQITLTVSGEISITIKAVPEEIIFNGLTAGEGDKTTVQIFGFSSKPLEIAGHEWGIEDIAQHFSAKLEPMPESQIKAEKGATGGALLHIQVKPGLPLGAFHQTIRLRTNMTDVSTLELPVSGSVASDISIAGPGWDNSRSVLTLGTIASAEGVQRNLMVLARGDQGKDLKLKPVSVSPENLLKVEIGAPKVLAGGRMTQIPIVVRVPKGSPPANHLGGSEENKSGRILIETNHPRAKSLRMLVRFAVEN